MRRRLRRLTAGPARVAVAVVVGAAAVLATAGAAPARAAAPGPIGGPQLAGRGVIVNYPAQGGRRLPRVRASAWVVADAGAGQVLAARDPHGWYRPASTLKVLPAIP